MLRIDTNFPGGNLKVFDIKDDVIEVAPALRDTETSWFFWSFRLTGAQGRRLTFRFVSDNPVGVRGPALSHDRFSWEWSNEDFGTDWFTVTIPGDAGIIYLSFCPLYTQEHLGVFLSTLETGEISSNVLTRSRKGRAVEVLNLGAPDNEAKYHVLITARHHACEAIANYVIEGIISSILHDKSEEAMLLREKTAITVIPFIDKDGVEDGDQGKNRIPHDHGRDYDRDDQIYPETKACAKIIKDTISKFGHIDFILDVHCPWIRSKGNESVYLVGKDSPNDPAMRKEFGGYIISSLTKESLPYKSENDIPYGVSWNTGSNYKKGATIGGWAGKFPEVKATTTIEVAYANADGIVVTAGAAREFGKAVAKALFLYISNN